MSTRDQGTRDPGQSLRSYHVAPGVRARKQWIDWLFRHACRACTLIGVLALGLLLYRVLADGLPVLDWQFLTSFASRKPAEAGILAGLAGTVWIILLTAAIAVPVGVAAAVYLEEYARPTRLNTLIRKRPLNATAPCPSGWPPRSIWRNWPPRTAGPT